MKGKYRVLIWLTFVWYFCACMPVSAQRVKRITELTPDELDIANTICARALKDHFGDRIMTWAKTTYHYLPSSDDGIVPELGKKLDRPITLISVALLETYRHSEVKAALKKRVMSLAADDDGKKYRIEKSLVLFSPSGGTMHISYESITIVPLLVVIE